MRAGMAASQADIRWANGATALTAGTRTLDTNGVGAVMLLSGSGTTIAVGATVSPQDLYRLDEAGAQHPLALGVGEGFIIRTIAAYGTSEVARYYVTLEWIETAIF